MPSKYHHAQLFLLRWGLMNFILPRLTWNYYSPDLSLLWSWNDKSHASVPSYWLRLGLTNFFAWGSPQTAILLITTSKVARITDKSHRHPAHP
jgi:hypothetical protein